LLLSSLLNRQISTNNFCNNTVSGPICNGTYSVEAIEDAFGSSLAVKHIFTLKHSIPFLTTIVLTALERTQLLEQLQESQRHPNKCIPMELFRKKNNGD